MRLINGRKIRFEYLAVSTIVDIITTKYTSSQLALWQIKVNMYLTRSFKRFERPMCVLLHCIYHVFRLAHPPHANYAAKPMPMQHAYENAKAKNGRLVTSIIVKKIIIWSCLLMTILSPRSVAAFSS